MHPLGAVCRERHHRRDTFRARGHHEQTIETHRNAGTVGKPVAQGGEQALVTAHLMALKGIRERVTDEDRLFAIDWAIRGLEAQTNPVTVDAAKLASYAGEYGPRSLIFEDGELYYQRQGRQPIRTIPLSDELS